MLVSPKSLEVALKSPGLSAHAPLTRRDLAARARVRVCIFVRQVRALRKKCAELEAENEILLEEAVSARHAAF